MSPGPAVAVPALALSRRAHTLTPPPPAHGTPPQLEERPELLPGIAERLAEKVDPATSSAGGLVDGWRRDGFASATLGELYLLQRPVWMDDQERRQRLLARGGWREAEPLQQQQQQQQYQQQQQLLRQPVWGGGEMQGAAEGQPRGQLQEHSLGWWRLLRRRQQADQPQQAVAAAAAAAHQQSRRWQWAWRRRGAEQEGAAGASGVAGAERAGWGAGAKAAATQRVAAARQFVV
jgi:hypothetical protein